jgi:regulator of sigma E protease
METPSWGEALFLSGEKTWEASKLILISIVKLIDGSLSLDTMGGPIKIAQISGQAAEHGLDSLAYLAAMLSVNLAILNLLPIPALDGGHLLFFSVEALTRRRPSLRVQSWAQQAGVLLLITLMIVVFYNDIMSLF